MGMVKPTVFHKSIFGSFALLADRAFAWGKENLIIDVRGIDL